MKKFVLAFCLPVMTAASLIGAGYATWYFDNQTMNPNLTIATEVTNEAEFGEFTKTGSAKLFLDQDKIAAADDGLNVNRHGITWQKSDVTESNLGDASTADLALTYYVTKALPTNTKIQIDVTFSYDIAFNTYLVATMAGWTSSTDTTTAKYTKTFDVTTTGTTALFTMPSEITFSYVSDDNAPTTQAKYSTMKTALNGKSFTLSATAKFVKIN